jgi:phosphatidylserine/phosphatidylglycerophosphate/cardiolipin synthase-like enzyme
VISSVFSPARWTSASALALALTTSPGCTPAAVSAGAATPAAISVCFAPEQDCAGLAIAAIERAQREILVNAYNLTTGAGIVEALVRARARGVDVRLIADKRTPCERNTGIDALADAGTPIWIDRTVPIAHAKTMVIDGTLTLMGSYNWTRNAARNSEDLNLVASPAVAAAYAAQWGTRQAVSVPFTARADWCRARPARNSLDAVARSPETDRAE